MRIGRNYHTNLLSLFSVSHHILKCSSQLNALVADHSELYSTKDLNLNKFYKKHHYDFPYFA